VRKGKKRRKKRMEVQKGWGCSSGMIVVNGG
jgi:hypothetical protein